jgi:signal peptidase I
VTDSDLMSAPPTAEEFEPGAGKLAAPARQSSSLGEALWEILQTLILAGLLIVFFRTFVFQNYIVDGNSMLPALEPGERVIVGRTHYLLGKPQRGDVIVLQYPRDPDRDFVKRIIGLPGETVSISNGQVFIDGRPLARETYVQNLSRTDHTPTRLGDNEYFVMGDNRAGSSDSRSWGPLHRRYIIGKAWLIYFPIGKLGFVPHAALELAP